MRLALGVPEPARLINFFMTQPLKPLRSSGLGGASVSATSTSPFGSTYTQRGCWRFAAKASTASPGAGAGFPPDGQPFAGATFTVGMTEECGAGSSGVSPVPTSDGSVDCDAHAPSRHAEKPAHTSLAQRRTPAMRQRSRAPHPCTLRVCIDLPHSVEKFDASMRSRNDAMRPCDEARATDHFL